MIKQLTKNRLKFIFWSAVVIATAYLCQITLIIPLFLISLGIYLKIRGADLKEFRFLHLIFLFLLSFVSSYFILKSGLPVFYIPFSLIPMLAALLFASLELALLLTLALSLSLASVPNSTLGPYYLTLLFLISGILSSVMVRGARRRTTVIRSGFVVGIAQAAFLFLVFYPSNRPGLFPGCAILLFNGIASGIIVLGVLPLFEYLFNTVTNISLLELADFHHPLLQQMILEAPGTYHHSLVVGNLSESACEAIGANALLARIGAYYHDVGKLQKPEYFSENQNTRESRHSNLSATMSRLIIMNHVKEGVELAKKHRLSPVLIDFIAQHHGNSLVYYFYRRALETLEENQEVKEEGFRYQGPKPNTRETAVVLLADSVEAATRALKDPGPAKIEEVVHKIINNKFIDRQLDECNLTLKDLDKIAAVFIRILGAIYHNRIIYPEDLKSEDNRKEFSKEDPRQSEKDKKGNP